MSFLYWLADLRTAAGDAFFMTLTNLGDEAAAIVILLIVFWCINKKAGYFMVYSTVFGMLMNQLLKSLFEIPRPWIRDPQFQAVEAAKETAGGYSFPSGHTATAVAVYGSAALYFKKNWVRILCVAIIAIVALSRMYLGVHTPADVGVSLLIGVVMILVLQKVLAKAEESEKTFWILQAVFLLCSVGLFVFLNVKGLPNDPTLTEEELLHGAASAMNNAWKILGMWLGLAISHWYDRFQKPFDTKAGWWA
ncbi:MAG: phosphatase PAP2 family protein, partial [Lachnospiraceae bacterium]|nr:phosphatase PAP2 family protein [Lachnospiraceae bacterium]